MKKYIPEETVARLPVYHRYLLSLSKQGVKNISSKKLANILKINDSQVRKDLSYFGKLGKQGAGYEVNSLCTTIAKILKLDQAQAVCIVGMGSLGSALAAYKGFGQLGLKIAAVFDKSENKISHTIRGHLCHDIAKLAAVIKSEKIEIALLTVPAEAAQEIAENLVAAGIKAILNFTPVKLFVTDKVMVNNVDLAVELKTLSFFT